MLRGSSAPIWLPIAHRPATRSSHWSRTELDLNAGPAAIAAAIDQAKPDVVVNCAAWTAVDACEDDPALAELINGTAVGRLADAVAGVGAHLIQVSTDYVFDGTKDSAYTEDDVPNPQSVYGRSKLLGERLAVESGADVAIVRTSWVYSRHGGNMVATICRLLQSHDTLTFVDDQIGHSTSTESLAVALRNLAGARATGTYHCTNAGAVSWFEFARAVAGAGGADPERVRPIATADLLPPRPAPRPANSRLANLRYESSFAPLPDFRDGLEAIVASYIGPA